MKHLTWAPLGAMALAIAAIAPAQAAEQKSVAVTAIVEHPALDAVRDGVKDALKAAFEAKLAAEPEFAADPDARLAWFYERTPFYDDHYLLYPIAREIAR